MFSGRILYLWQGLNDGQRLSNGELDANSVSHAKRELLLQGVLPMRIRSVGRLDKCKWSPSVLMIITRQLATMLSAGLPLANCLQLLASEHPQPMWRYLLKRIHWQVSQGYPFSQVLDGYPQIFPVIFRELIATGELTGRLDICCLQLAEQQEKLGRLQQKISKALSYPLFVLIIALAVTLLMLIFVLPEFAEVYASFDAELPAFTRWIMGFSDLLRDYGFVWLILLIISLIFYQKKLRLKADWQEREQQLLLKLPLCGNLLKLGCLARVMRTLTMTQNAGVPLLAGLRIAANSANNPLFKRATLMILVQIEQGVTLHQALQNQPLFPTLSRQLIRVGEESGSLDIMLEKLAAIYEQEVENVTEQLTQKIEPLLMVVLGIIVGGLVIAMYLPIFQLGNVVGR